jgi:DNA-binding NarL/FixJ family response regulator
MKKARVLIADDHDVVRSGLRLLFRGSSEFAVVAEAADGREAVRLAEKHNPDVAIMDISMPGFDGIEATRRIKEAHPDIKVVILSVHEDEEYAHQVLRAGASGYVLKNASKKEIFQAVRSALRGERFFSGGISKLIIERFIKHTENHGEEKQESLDSQGLTKREVEVLEYIAKGFTNRQIAEKLFLSFRTVNTHRSNLMHKLNIHDTAGLVRHAISIGLVKTQT